MIATWPKLRRAMVQGPFAVGMNATPMTDWDGPRVNPRSPPQINN